MFIAAVSKKGGFHCERCLLEGGGGFSLRPLLKKEGGSFQSRTVGPKFAKRGGILISRVGGVAEQRSLPPWGANVGVVRAGRECP